MPTLFEYYQNDFIKSFGSLDSSITYTMTTGEIKSEVIISYKIIYSSYTDSKFLVFYIPFTQYTLLLCKTIIEDLSKFKNNDFDLKLTLSRKGEVNLGDFEHKFSNRVFIYLENSLSETESEMIGSVAKEQYLYITLRDYNYMVLRSQVHKNIAFISHDSRDKELIAKPLANKLFARSCYVWYDEYSLKVGDSLRESIEKGIRETEKCILIITPNFLENSGWTKSEFNSIFSKGIMEKKSPFLPIWYNVNKEQVYNYSTTLADIYALQWPSKIEDDNEYERQVELVISKVHSAISQ